MKQWQQLKAEDGHEFDLYVSALTSGAEAAGKGVIVVVQEIFGVNSHIRSVCDRLADAGYLAVAPALFDRYRKGYEAGYSPQEVEQSRAFLQDFDFDAACRDIEAAVGAFAERGPVSVVGFCLGGSLAWLMAARDDRLAASVGYYGGRIPDFVDATPRCPTLLHFGEQDQGIPLEGVESVRRRHPEVPIHLYPAGHGFNCDQRGSYHAQSAQLAWQRTLDFIAAQS